MTDESITFDFNDDYSAVLEHFTGKDGQRVFDLDYGIDTAHIQLSNVAVEGGAWGVSCFITLVTSERKEHLHPALIVLTQTKPGECHAVCRLLPDRVSLAPLPHETMAERSAARLWAWGVGRELVGHVWRDAIGKWLTRKTSAAQPMIADNLGGTLIYTRNDQGQMVISGTVNPDYLPVLLPKHAAIVPSGTDIQQHAFEVTSAGDRPHVISIQDERIERIRSMFSGGNNPSDKKIATELIISESLAKQLRLKAGIKRREREKSMS